jgi:hypothetical protein
MVVFDEADEIFKHESNLEMISNIIGVLSKNTKPP